MDGEQENRGRELKWSKQGGGRGGGLWGEPR